MQRDLLVAGAARESAADEFAEFVNLVPGDQPALERLHQPRLLILLNGFFSMAEMAVISARKARLQHAADNGREGARIALELKQDAGRFLSTVQIGITALNVLASVLGGATLADIVDRWLIDLGGWSARNATAISFLAVVAIISYLTLIFGELVPKRIAFSRPEVIASRLSGILRIASPENVATQSAVTINSDGAGIGGDRPAAARGKICSTFDVWAGPHLPD